MNVLEYFETRWPDHTILFEPTNDRKSPQIRDILAEMTLDSPCGEDCKTALDAAAGFDGCISMAYGEYRAEAHRLSIEHRAHLLRAAACVCICYIRG